MSIHRGRTILNEIIYYTKESNRFEKDNPLCYVTYINNRWRLFMAIIEFAGQNKEIGLHTRTTPRGPEAELIDLFLAQFHESKVESKKKYALFYEPLIPTGFPDIVIAEYREDAFQSWASARKSLTIIDLKLLHYLYFVHGASAERIITQLALSKAILLESIERLLDANVIVRKSQTWQPLSIKQTYGITAIRTIEAKLGKWDRVLKQAFLNKWFASESYVMLPVVAPSEENHFKANSKGIGIFSLTKDRKHIRRYAKAERMSLPTCYASWLFNEWIGRRIASA